MPFGAVATVAVGLALTVAIAGIDLASSGGGSKEIDWVVVEAVETPAPASLGPGEFGLARTTISAIEPITSGDLLFRVSGVVSIDSGGSSRQTVARCDVTAAAEETVIARTPRKRAAWPRPSEELQRQEVPELSVVKFRTRGAAVIGLPLRDSFRRYTDSAAPTEVDWDGFEEQTQNWVWTMEDGTGDGAATLGYAVIFRTLDRPSARIKCRGRIGQATEEITVDVRLDQWPVPAEDEA